MCYFEVSIKNEKRSINGTSATWNYEKLAIYTVFTYHRSIYLYWECFDPDPQTFGWIRIRI
jgi:hypothetical protein